MAESLNRRSCGSAGLSGVSTAGQVADAGVGGHDDPPPAGILKVSVSDCVEESDIVAVTVILSVVSPELPFTHMSRSLYVLAPLIQPARPAWLVSQDQLETVAP